MKKIIFAMLLPVMLFILPACGNSGDEAQETERSRAQTETTEKNGVQTETEKKSEEEMESRSEEIEQGNAEQEVTEMKLKIQIENIEFTATLADNSSVDALKELMAEGPLILNMSDYANMEKGADLGVTLPQNNEPMNTQPGDVILYQGKTFVIYYDTNSWSLTPIAKIDDVDVEELKAALGSGDVTVTLWFE